MDAFLQLLADTARRYPTENKWVLVPSQDLGWMLGERLLQGGHNWLNLRFITPLKLALQSAGPALLGHGVHACPPGLRASSLYDLPGHPYEHLMHQPGMAEWLWEQLQSHRLDGQRWEPMDWIFQGYLDQQGWADAAMVFQHRGQSRVGEGDLVLVYPDHPWPLRVREFFQALPGRHLHPQPQTQSQPELHYFCAARREIELSEVLSRIRGPLDQVEIVIGQQDAPLLHDLLTEHDLPATFSHGLPITLSRPGQALRDFVRWLTSGTSGYQFRELLIANLLVAPPSSWVAARLIANAGVRWGRADFGARLRALKSTSTGAPWLVEQSQQAEQLALWFDALYQRFPVNEDGTISVAHWCKSLQYAVTHWLDQHDREASQRLSEFLADFSRLNQYSEHGRFFHSLHTRLQRVHWRSSRPRPGHIHVTHPESIGYSGRPTVFVTGQEADQEPPQLTNQRSVTLSYSTRSRDGQSQQLPNASFERILPPFVTKSAPPLMPLETLWHQYTDLRCGHLAQIQRGSGEFTPYDGNVPEAALALPTSASRIQALAACPFQYFLAHGLRVYPKPLPEPSRQSWLDPMERGHVLHEMYAGWVEGKGSPEKLLETALSKLPPAAADWLDHRERLRLLAEFNHYLTLPQPDDPLACELPFRFHLPQLGLELGGCIDRVDRLENGLRIVDYKTGRTFALNSDGQHFQGRQLQHSLYALVASQLFQRPVVETGYLHTHPGSQQVWTGFQPVPQTQLSELLQLLFWPIKSGAYLQSHRTEEDCTYCHYRAACVGRDSRAIRKKLNALPERQQLLATP